MVQREDESDHPPVKSFSWHEGRLHSTMESGAELQVQRDNLVQGPWERRKDEVGGVVCHQEMGPSLANIT